MEVQDSTILDAFSSGGKIQYRLPHFQREYAWEQANWDMFFDDVLALYDAEWIDLVDAPKHFLGTIVVQYERKHGLSLHQYKLVDGQQRMVTASLLLCALRDLVGPSSNLYDEINGYLVNAGQSGELYYKLVPSQMYGDRKAYSEIIRQSAQETDSESQIATAFQRFVSRLRKEENRRSIDVERLANCIVSCMEIVYVDLNEGESPYKIFESLNAKGKALTQADLVRNFVAMMLPSHMQAGVFNEYWRGIEDKLQEKRKIGRIGELTAFLRHYLSLKTGVVPNMNRVYETFRSRMTKEFGHHECFVAEIGELHRFSTFYDRLLRPENEGDKLIHRGLARLQRAESVTAYPFVMYLYDLLSQNAITRQVFVDALALLENFIIRVFLNGGSTTGFNRLFPSLVADIDSSDILSSLASEIAKKRMYPSDNRIRQNLLTNALYDGNRRARLVFVMETLSRHLSSDDGYAVLSNEPTIEHIMPQNLNDEWRRHLGVSAEAIHQDYLNTIGNLTLVTQGKNSEFSDGAFESKKSKLAQHALEINREYFGRDILSWDAGAIRNRTTWLTDLILKVWPALGKPSRVVGVKGTRPLSLTIRDKQFDSADLYGWRGLLLQMVNCLHDLELLTDFDGARREFGYLISAGGGVSEKYYRQSSRGWWIYVNQNAESVVRYCGLLADFCELGEDEWDYTYE